MSEITKFVAIDQEKGIAQGFDPTYFTANIQLQAMKSFIRDPGTDKEIEISNDNVSISFNMNGNIHTDESRAELIAAHPEAEELLALIQKWIIAKYSFPAAAKNSKTAAR